MEKRLKVCNEQLQTFFLPAPVSPTVLWGVVRHKLNEYSTNIVFL